MENTFIEVNPGKAGLVVDIRKDDNVKNNKTKVTVKKDGQEAKAYFLYYSVNHL